MSEGTRRLPDRAALTDDDARTGEEDLAMLRDAQFLAVAQAQQRQAAALTPRATPGVCTNCGGACLARAVYCDEDCRADHEARLSMRSRKQGRA